MSRERNKPPTILDVAQRAGVSKSVVSRALLGQRAVREEVRLQVLTAAEELGYVANAMARGLVSRRTRTLGVVLHDVTDPFAGYLHEAMQEHASECGYSMVVATSPGDLTLDNAVTALSTLVSLQVEGLLICSARFPSERVLPFVGRLPVIAAGRNEPEIPSVCVDDRDGGEKIADHIIALGHRHAGVILIDGTYSYSQNLRGLAMINRLRSAGVTVTVREAKSNVDALSAIPDLLTIPGLSALLCPNDRTQLAVLELCRERNIGVPEQLSVTGFDGIGPLATPLLGLTTLRQPIEQMGRSCVDLMISAVEDDEPGNDQHVLLQGTLVVGQTAGPPRHER